VSEQNNNTSAGPEAVATEWARMLDDGAIVVGTMTHEGKQHTHGSTKIGPDHHKYAQAKAPYRLEKPGDATSIDMEFRNGEWVYIGEPRKLD
jgi:hypothetical protein